jgi:hypothetical protein
VQLAAIRMQSDWVVAVSVLVVVPLGGVFCPGGGACVEMAVHPWCRLTQHMVRCRAECLVGGADMRGLCAMAPDTAAGLWLAMA